MLNADYFQKSDVHDGSVIIDERQRVSLVDVGIFELEYGAGVFHVRQK